MFPPEMCLWGAMPSLLCQKFPFCNHPCSLLCISSDLTPLSWRRLIRTELRSSRYTFTGGLHHSEILYLFLLSDLVILFSMLHSHWLFFCWPTGYTFLLILETRDLHSIWARLRLSWISTQSASLVVHLFALNWEEAIFLGRKYSGPLILRKVFSPEFDLVRVVLTVKHQTYPPAMTRERRSRLMTWLTV